MKTTKSFSSKIFFSSLAQAFIKFNPISLLHNPVIFITEIGAFLSTFEAFIPSDHQHFSLITAIWLWITVFFANFADGIAISRNQAQATALKKGSIQMMANKILNDNSIEIIPASSLKKGDKVIIKINELIPADGEIIKGTASIDESSVTGESNPVVKMAGTDNNSVIGGTKVVSDEIEIIISANPGETFLDKMITLIEAAHRKKTYNEIALTVLLSGLTFIFLIAIISLKIFGIYFNFHFSIAILTAFLVCLIPTTIAGLLNAIGIAGINRLMKHNILALNGQAVEVAGDIDMILIDKTGTITYGNRSAIAMETAPDVTDKELATAAYIASFSDQTSEGRSIVDLTLKKFPELKESPIEQIEIIPFSAITRISGVNINNILYRKGSIDAIEKLINNPLPYEIAQYAKNFAREGGTPLIITKNQKVLGIFNLKDKIKEGLAEQFARFRLLGIKTIMLTGDNPLTAETIAKQAGVDDFIAEVSPEQKLNYLLKMQKQGHIIAMTGDGINDAPALAYANVGVAMGSGTQAAKEAGNMIDLDSNPIKLFKIVEIGKQMLTTRGSLTTFSIANDLAKYFAIIPAMLSPYIPAIKILNVMHLATSESAILSAVIFNAFIIILLIPLALKGVKLVADNALHILKRNLLIYGIGGVILPFIGIKIIDLILVSLGLI